MVVSPFVGRAQELERLELLYRKEIPGLVVLKGRRRIGKSRLIAEFALQHREYKFWDFSGLAPQAGMTAQMQRDHFARRLATLLNIPPLTFQDWNDAFMHLSQQVSPGDIVLLDEISWMGAKDPTFIPKLKAWWDLNQDPFLLVFCGSVSTWIEDNILRSTAFFGRINLTLTLEPLTISESSRVINALGYQGSDYDTFTLLSILGGIPWYLEQVSSGMTAHDIIKDLCFVKDGVLVTEFDRIFHDLFNGKGAAYKKILDVLKDGMKTLVEIRKAINFSHSGTLSEMLERLIVAGFVTKQNLWSFKTRQPRRQSLYRISDPYTRFYLKVIAPQRHKIDTNSFSEVALTQLAGFEAHLGFQLEYLLLQNRALLLKAIGISSHDIVADGPYRQTSTTKRKGCQIDYLVQTATNNLFVCEFKFRRRELSSSIIEEVKDKINALKVPRGFAAIPVLFHLGGVAPAVETADYFYRVINITDFLSD